MPAHVHIPGTWSTVLGTRGLLRELVIFVQEFNLYFALSFTCSLPQSSLSGCLISLLSGDCLSLCSLCKKISKALGPHLGPSPLVLLDLALYFISSCLAHASVQSWYVNIFQRRSFIARRICSSQRLVHLPPCANHSCAVISD